MNVSSTLSEKHAQHQTHVKRIEATVCFFIRRLIKNFWESTPEVYLSIKGRKIGKGFRNGYGGVVENTETPRMCTHREVFVESGFGIIVHPNDLNYVALGEFITENDDGTRIVAKIHFFIADNNWHGNFIDSEEMFGGQWYPLDKLPFNELMPADRYWLPIVLQNNSEGRRQFFLIDAVYGQGQQTLLRETSVTPIHQLKVD